MESFREFKNYLRKELSTHALAESEADDILSQILGVEKKDLFSIDKISKSHIRKAKNILAKRLRHIPLEKQFNCAYFYGRKFYVNDKVLTPRQDTEILVEQTLNILQDGQKVLDLCTGSGIIAITLACEKQVSVTASDISNRALSVAKKNAKKHNVKINFVKSNLFDEIAEQYDLIVSNPPYIQSAVIDTLADEVKNHDPRISLDGGESGLEFYENIALKAKKHLTRKGTVIVEIGYDQALSVSKIFQKYGYVHLEIKKDYAGNDRVVSAKVK